jgi:hypothetical protein
LSSDELQFLYTRLVFWGTEEDITKINMRSYDDEADMKSYKPLFKIRDENDYLFQAISNMVHLLSRSETSNKWHDYEDNGKKLIKKITEDINNCYRRFDNELLYKGVPAKKITVCSKTRCNAVFSTSYIYPVLPLLFVLNAIYKIKGDGNKHDKAELLKYNTSCSFIDNVYETFVISEASEHLLERVEDVLVKHLVLYKRTVFPTRKDCYSFIQHRITRCMGRNGCCLNITKSWFISLQIIAEKMKTKIEKKCSRISNGKLLRKCVHA